MKYLTIANKSKVLLFLFVLGLVFNNNFTSHAELKSESVPELTKYVGGSIDVFPSTFKSTALQNKSAERLPGTSSCKTYYDLIETSEDLENFYETTIKANLDASGYGITADASFEKYIKNHTKINNNTVSLVIMVVYDGPEVSLSNAEFTDSAKKLIEAKNTDTFYRLYGNSYVRTSHLGGILFLSYSAELTSSSNLTKETLKTVLNMKYKALNGDASIFTTKTSDLLLKQTRVSGYSYDTRDLISKEVIDTKDVYKARVSEFADYYNSIVNGTSNLDYYVVGRELAPYYDVIGSSYYNPSFFPKFYDLSKFEVRNININNPGKQPNNTTNKITVSWSDICPYETGYKIYIKTPSMSSCKLVKTVSANTTKASVDILSTECKEGYDLWVVPYKDIYEGNFSYSKHISPNTYHGNMLKSGETLIKGEYLESENGRYRLVFQEDSNFVTYDTMSNWRAIWSSGTWNKPVTYCLMNSSEIFQIIDSNNKAYFSTTISSKRSSSRYPSSRPASTTSISNETNGPVAVIENNGNFVIYDRVNRLIWSSDPL